jgi:(S)-ureidoglycine aminohydrolase
MAQGDILPSGVYNSANQADETSAEPMEVLKGSTLDLSRLEIHMITIGAKQLSKASVVSNDVEQLLLIKEGSLKVTIGNNIKTLEAGGVVLLVAGDKQLLQNVSGKPVIYYLVNFKSKDGADIERGKKGGGSFVKDWSEFEVKTTDKGESRPIFVRPTSMFKSFDVHATALNPGFESHPAHTHRAEEIILMIKGMGEMQIGDTFHKVAVGNVILVNANVPHAIKNTGTEQCGYYAIQWRSNAD